MSKHIWYKVHDNCDVEMIDYPLEDIESMHETQTEGMFIYTDRKGYPHYIYAKEGMKFI